MARRRNKKNKNKYSKLKMQWNKESIKDKLWNFSFFFEQKFQMAKTLFGKQFMVNNRAKVMKRILNDKWYDKFEEQEKKRGNVIE
jgi:hypothetical protein